MTRFLQDEQKRRRDREASTAPASIERERHLPLDADISSLSPEQCQEFTAVIMQQRFHGLSKDQLLQIQRNEIAIENSHAAGRRMAVDSRTAAAYQPVLFLPDAASPIRQDRSRAVVLETDILHVFSQPTQRAVNNIIERFLKTKHDPTSLGFLFSNFFVFTDHVLTLENNVFAQRGSVTLETMRAHWNSFTNQLDNPALQVEHRKLLKYSANLFFETASTADVSALRNLLRLKLHSVGRLTNDGFYIRPSPAAAPADSTQSMSQQNNNCSKTNEFVNGASSGNQQQVEEN
jgi:hypothetical protein